jgi:hypothetical protein
VGCFHLTKKKCGHLSVSMFHVSTLPLPQEADRTYFIG